MSEFLNNYLILKMRAFHLSPLSQMHWEFKNISLLHFGNTLDNGPDKILKYHKMVHFNSWSKNGFFTSFFFWAIFSFFNHPNMVKHCKVWKHSELHWTRHLTEPYYSNTVQMGNESFFSCRKHRDLLPHLLPQSIRECAFHQKQMSACTKQFECFLFHLLQACLYNAEAFKVTPMWCKTCRNLFPLLKIFSGICSAFCIFLMLLLLTGFCYWQEPTILWVIILPLYGYEDQILYIYHDFLLPPPQNSLYCLAK